MSKSTEKRIVITTATAETGGTPTIERTLTTRSKRNIYKSGS